MIAFIGSTRAGRAVAATAGQHPSPTTTSPRSPNMPLGCPSATPRADAVAVGPLIDAAQRDTVHRVVTTSIDDGARLVTGGTYENLFYRPTVLADVPLTAPAYAQEIFGPVAPVVTFDTVDDATRLATDTGYGLSLGILTRDITQALRLAERIPSGLVHINDQTVNDEAVAPFGGVGDSGNGARHGGTQANLAAFTDTNGRRFAASNRSTRSDRGLRCPLGGASRDVRIAAESGQLLLEAQQADQRPCRVEHGETPLTLLDQPHPDLLSRLGRGHRSSIETRPAQRGHRVVAVCSEVGAHERPRQHSGRRDQGHVDVVVLEELAGVGDCGSRLDRRRHGHHQVGHGATGRTPVWTPALPGCSSSLCPRSSFAAARPRYQMR